MPKCPVAAALNHGAVALGEVELGRAAAELAAPVRVGVTGRSGAGRSTVARALRGAGLEADENGTADVAVYVFVERLTPEDRGELAAVRQPCVAVLNKADLAGFGGPGPMATAASRCARIQRETGLPAVALAGLAASAVIDDGLRDGLGSLVQEPDRVEPEVRRRLLAELDLFGIATAVAAIAAGADIEDALRRTSGVERLVAALDRAASAVRYRRAVAAVTALAGPAAYSTRIADFLAGDALVLARMASATKVVEAAGLAVGPGRTRADHLAAAIAWQRYSHGPVSDLHRACGADIARGSLRLWART